VVKIRRIPASSIIEIGHRTMLNTRRINIGVTGGLEWVYASAAKARGIVFVPPLIGGHALQHLRAMRHLLYHQFSLFSFNYAGHGHSEGSFCLRTSLLNTQQMLDLTMDYGARRRLPVFGVASCFAAMPLLKAAVVRGEPMTRIVLISAVPHWRLAKATGHFLRFWRQSDRWRPTRRGLVETIRAYRDNLLPGLAHRRQSFGVLARDRVHWARVFYELFSQRIVPNAAIRHTPVLCAYGQRDHLLRQIGFSEWSDYEAQIQSICRKVRFRTLNGDHFLADPPVRSQLLKEVVRFLDNGG
jgi:hypothetical protein